MGWIIAGAVVLGIMLLLVIPLSADAVWDGKLRLDLKWLFIRKTLYPGQKKKEKEKAKEVSEKPAEKPAKAKKKKVSAEKLIDTVLDYIKRCGGGARMILRDLRVSVLEINWTIACDDAAECAIRYGRMNAYLYSAVATLSNFIRIRRTKIRLVPDYTEEDEEFSARAMLSITPLVTIIGLVRVAWGFFMKQIADSNKVEQQRSGQNERKESRGTDGCVDGKPQGAD